MSRGAVHVGTVPLRALLCAHCPELGERLDQEISGQRLQTQGKGLGLKIGGRVFKGVRVSGG